MAIGRTRRNIILSTGMSTLEEVEAALAVLSWGIKGMSDPDSIEQVLAEFRGGADDALAGKVTLLHCTSQYPAPDADANLRAMMSMERRFRLPSGQ